MKKRFSKAVLICLAGVLLISSFELFSQCRQKISREELQNKIISNSKSFPYLENASLPIPFNASIEPSRPFYKNIALQNNKNEAIPQPESLCDNGYYWMGGPTWTADTDGNAIVWGAGGNLYFADANDPTHPIEMWWGDIPLRVRIHNGIALFFCYFYTYAFDVSVPLSPAWLSYGPGYSQGFWDAYSSPDDSYWILTDWAFYGGLTIWDPSTLNYKWGPLPNPQGGSYFDLFIDDQKDVVIAGDYSSGLLDFYDISNLACSSPVLIGQISDNNAGLVYYDYPYLYSSYEPWQYYNQWIYGGSEEGYCAVSVIFLLDTLNPDNNFFIKEYTANYDVVSMKNSPNGFIVGYLQNRAVEWAPQFDYLINGCFINNKASSLTYDCAYQGSTGVAACSAGGARFFNSFFTETSHFITGEYAYDVVPWGDYLFVPSGKAGVAIIDNSDPSWPRTLSFLEIDTSVIPEVKFIAVSQNGERLYLSDGTDKVWFANISNKTNPFIISYSYYWSTLSSGNVSKLITYGNRLLIASESGEIDLLDISNPNLMIQLSSINYGESVVDMEVFELASYPGTSFLAVTTNANFYIFDFSSNFFSEVGFLENFGNYFIAISGNVAYLKNSTFIQPVLFEGSFPSFYLTIDGTTPLNIGYSWGPPDFIKKYDDTKLVCAGDDTNYGGYPSVFLIDIGTDPLAPQLLPYEQPGVLPFDLLSGLSVKDGLIYYATDYFGTGALTIEPDYDLPFATSSLVVTPQNPDIPSHSPNPNYWLTGNANLSITVRDNASAITKVRFKYNNRTIRTLTNQTPAGQDGVYSFIWDTTLWT
ncbi:MAG: hypothetical protein GYA35_07285, partial [Thermoanaerobaculaceae bacterium]|nr:hypothetical protein [Thermoanaerobaculaceae bacterium]